ncbi:RNA polymerase ECF-type sigma factor [hydrothermal vent metagenome]|uniref:RNA polymerase ECF-type sigma factor n=1 Tax=hydrothermal vent metagenome TaxID=652676 RepID=A0A3B0XL10_9ZZZZ
MANKQQRFDILVKAFYQDAYRYAYWICKSKPLAEDLVQEAYLRAWKHFDKLNDEKAAKAWLFTIIRRENARQYERYQPDLVDIDDVPVNDMGISPMNHSEHSIVQRHIANLDREFREPLILQLVGGFKAEEISQILDLNKNTVLTRLFRARNKLKKDILDKPKLSRTNDG